ncbi:MAG TPA: subclass B3 metallo-beta-lactamase [Steroidobacteraceae bacterium]|nr:subclass B3 metallo-beta-lactamase [Steroidobacteraceae bacterium]
MASDPPKACDPCDEWNKPQEPFRIFGDTYFVGTEGLASILIASTDGSILLDGGLPQSAPLIAANIRKLGFDLKDVRLIVNSHMHYDHAGGIAALQRASGATVAASAAGAVALEQGGPAEDDPQITFGREHNEFPAVADVRVVRDDETLRVGKLAITARFTPGHTPGGTTWTWRSCEAAKCLDLVYADSLNSVSAPDFRFTGDGKYPSRVEIFRRSIARVEALPCDLLLAPHPPLFDMKAKIERRVREPASNPFIDSQGCKAYAASARKNLELRIAQENASSN